MTSDIYNGLKPVSDDNFPKRCNTCGEIYYDQEDFLAKTAKAGLKTGLKESYDEDDNRIVELFRNCACGSTLLENFECRRDETDQGEKRRVLFRALLEKIISKGFDEEVADMELRKVARGKESELIKGIGLADGIDRLLGELRAIPYRPLMTARS